MRQSGLRAAERLLDVAGFEHQTGVRSARLANAPQIVADLGQALFPLRAFGTAEEDRIAVHRQTLRRRVGEIEHRRAPRPEVRGFAGDGRDDAGVEPQHERIGDVGGQRLAAIVERMQSFRTGLPQPGFDADEVDRVVLQADPPQLVEHR